MLTQLILPIWEQTDPKEWQQLQAEVRLKQSPSRNSTENKVH